MAQEPNETVSPVYASVTSEAWRTLLTTRYEPQTTLAGTKELLPVIGSSVKALEGKTIRLQGYYYPIETITGEFLEIMFTALPVNACFFCGVGGPESVAQIKMKSPSTYTERLVTIEGRFHINTTNPDALLYQLSDVIAIE